MTTYGEKWKAAKKLFKDTAKVKKPSAKVDSFFRKPAGIDKTLEAVDKAGAKQINFKAADLREFEEAIAEFRVAAAAYVKVLDATVGAEPTGTDKVAYQKGVAVLKTQLKALDSSMKSMVTSARSSVSGRKGMEVMADSLMDLIESSCNSAEAFIAKVRAKPTPEMFNTSIEKSARDITQNIGNIDKLTAKGFVFAKAQPTNLFKVLKAWGNDGRRVPDTATPSEVLRELGAFEQAVDGVRRWAA
jgi:hypothetical protein